CDAEVVGEAVIGAHRHAAVAARVPGEPDPRTDLLPLPVDGRALREPWIAKVVQTRGRVRDCGALDPPPEPIDVEAVHGAVRQEQWKEWLPANAKIHRQALRHAPRVLPVHAEIILARAPGCGRTLIERADAP